jgi:Xaa-Pro aminopeptidase
VLKGHIALAMAQFPQGTTGGQLDALARMPLWQAGLDYDHGTGHGVGSFLNVHEGPQRIGKKVGGAALQPGMIISNEPGYYKNNAYGIRIENLVVVQPAAQEGFLCFETLTLVPIDRRAIHAHLLSAAEKDWLNAYHARVLATLSPQLAADERAWLNERCRPL